MRIYEDFTIVPMSISPQFQSSPPHDGVLLFYITNGQNYCPFFAQCKVTQNKITWAHCMFRRSGHSAIWYTESSQYPRLRPGSRLSSLLQKCVYWISLFVPFTCSLLVSREFSMSIRINTLTSLTIGQIRNDIPGLSAGTLPIKLQLLYLLMYLKF